MHFDQTTIALSSIDFADNTYRITTETCIDDLTSSIKKLGLINSPILKKKGTTFTIISGFRRIEACRNLSCSNIKARLLDPETQKLECIRLAISDNAFQRKLNLIEQSRSVYMLSGFFKDNQSLAEEACCLNLPGNSSLIGKIKKLSLFPTIIQNLILNDTLSLVMALALSRFEENVSIALAQLFDDLKLSLSKQRELIVFVSEIAFREDIPIMEVLNGNELRNIITDEDLDRTQKTQRIRFYLKKRRFPKITTAEKTFKEHVKALNLDKHTKLIPPKDFEGPTYCFNLYFKNLKELKARKTDIEKMIGNPAIKKILD